MNGQPRSGLVARRSCVRITGGLLLASVLLVGCGDRPVQTDSPSPASTSATPEIDPTETEQALLDALVRFARSTDPADLDGVPFAGEVALGLGPQPVLFRSREELADPDNWVLDQAIFRGYVGPFSALEQLRRDAEFSVTVGPHPHCASPPMPPPPGLEDHRRLSLQPASTRSCLQWFTVDLFLDADGVVDAITVDFYEP
jgi:hypothetical protein